MRTTVTLDDDAAALIEQERRRSGGSFKEVVNRLIRRGARQVEPMTTPPLPLLPGRLLVDITDVSATLGDDDDERGLKGSSG